MKHKFLLVLVALASAGMLAACGGDDDGQPSEAPNPPVFSGDRIEPLDTARLPEARARAQASMLRAPAVSAGVAQVHLGPLLKPRQELDADTSIALKIGQGRAVAATAQADDVLGMLHWQALPEGLLGAAIRFESEGAQGLRLGLQVEHLPLGTLLRVRADDGSAMDMPYELQQRMLQGNETAGLTGPEADTLWMPSTDGPASTLEIILPAGALPENVALAMPQLSHLTHSVPELLSQPRADQHIGRADACNLDVMCSPELDAASRSVAKILLVDNGSSFVCSGVLLNDTDDSQTPYLLTARHCVNRQAVASSVELYWFFRAARCGSSPAADPDRTRQVGGAQWLYSAAPEDSTLLRLHSAPPRGVVYAGSYFGSGFGLESDVDGVHHARADLQKVSSGFVDGYYNCRENSAGAASCSSSTESDAGMVGVRWRSGVTESGSSGSPLFLARGRTHYVVGNLWGGGSSCSSPQSRDYYGRFERSFHHGMGNWLAP